MRLVGMLEIVGFCMQITSFDGRPKEEAASQEGALAHHREGGLMGQISLQALLDQSTAPPGFYRGGFWDTPTPQDLDRAKSTSYQAHIVLLLMFPEAEASNYH